MIIDCISDLHGHLPNLEGGDLLLLGGDYVARDDTTEYLAFFDWLKAQNYRKKIFISGNHDNQAMSQFDWGDAEYLYDSGTEFEGFKIWGSPWTSWFNGINPKCCAYTKHHERDLAKKWEMIPHDTHILVTHSPPWGILDDCMKGHRYENVGSKTLLERVKHLKNLELHVFGHIHEAYGMTQATEVRDVTFVNASYVDCNYRPVNKPIRIEA